MRTPTLCKEKVKRNICRSFFGGGPKSDGGLWGPKTCQLKCYSCSAFFVHFGLPSAHCIRSAISLKSVPWEAFSCTFRGGNFLQSPTRTSCLLVFPGSFVSPVFHYFFACGRCVRWFLLSSFLFSSSGANVLATKKTNEAPSQLRNYTTSPGRKKKGPADCAKRLNNNNYYYDTPCYCLKISRPIGSF